MIRIVNEPKGVSWEGWKNKAALATRALHSRYKRREKIEIDVDLYKEQRLTLLKVFRNKCGYCEVILTAADHLGDVEHYRPKGRVTDERGDLVFTDRARTKPHPGYFWLAYRWDNLFPACIACNRPGSGPDGIKSGKWDCFPVAKFRALRPGDEKKEAPLLLNPWLDNPNDHLTFDDDLAVLGSKTERGRETIRILGLNRDGLVELRRQAIRSIKREFWESQQAYQRGDKVRYQDAVTIIRDCIFGNSQFSAVCTAAIKKEKARAEQFLQEI